MKYREINIEENNWKATHDLEQHCPFTFSLENDDNIRIVLNGITIGSLNESMAMPLKAVRHDFMQKDGYRVKTTSVIPFGSEPAVLRKFDYLGNILKVTTDVRMKAPVVGNIFSIDDLVIQGNWKKFAVINMSGGNRLNNKLEWHKISSEDSVIYDSDDLFGVLLLESEKGIRLEIGTGFDIWRWNIAEKTEGVVGNLKVESANGEIIVKRNVMTSEAEFKIPKRDWRFNWYLSWDCGEKKSGEKKDCADCFSIDQFEWSEAGTVKASGIYEDSPCLHSKAAKNRLRKWLRSIINKVEGKEVKLVDLNPGICENSAHLEKSKIDKLLHWDLSDIIDFWFWGNRQLRRKESSLTIFSAKEEIFSELPSFSVMGKMKMEEQKSPDIFEQ